MPGAWEQLDHELAVIGALGYPGYFLTVWDIVAFCRGRTSLPGPGSAANSAVCYALGITNVDAVYLGLLFERFLSPARDGPPDIDVDIESGGGRRSSSTSTSAMAAPRRQGGQRHHLPVTVGPPATWARPSDIRSRQVDTWSNRSTWRRRSTNGGDFPPLVKDLAGELLDFPRHLGIHCGGMVICDRPLVDVCPVERARMPGRSVLQWDKDDCAAAGLVKFDLLGLGMLTALHHMVDLVRDFHGVTIDLARLDQDPAVYDLVCRADTVGVFQVESRAR